MPIGTSFLLVRTTYEFAGTLSVLFVEIYESLTRFASLPLLTCFGTPEK